MGSFNYGCLISSASIQHGDRTGAIALVPNKFRYRERDCNTNATDHYIPVAAPIYGTYDDYGALENIEQTPVVDFLVKATAGFPIDVLMKVSSARNALDTRVRKHFYPDALPFETDKSEYRPFTIEEAVEQGFVITDTKVVTGKWSTSKMITLTYDNDENPIEIIIEDYKNKGEKKGSHPYLLMDDESAVHGRNHIAYWTDFLTSIHAQTGVWLWMEKQKNQQWNEARDIAFTFFLPEAYDVLVNSKEPILRDIYTRSLDSFQDEYPKQRGYPMGYMGEDTREILTTLPTFYADVYANIYKYPEHWKPLFVMIDVLASMTRIYTLPNMGEQCGNSYAEQAIGNFLSSRAAAQIAEYEE